MQEDQNQPQPEQNTPPPPVAQPVTVEHTPLIDPELVKDVIKPTAVSVPETEGKSKPTVDNLGPKEYCWGTGRRKSSVARVRIRPGTGQMKVNGKDVANYFANLRDRNDVHAPLVQTDSAASYDVWVNVYGGGSTGQAGAVVLGLARALVQAQPSNYDALRASGFLTRDARKVERKKYGKRGARRSYQFSKR
ncbi:MAG: 30S ribosomal protein S9 [Planctomycetes bacterium]|nr:30S ribosomal protein S9 [Planctomycetota bacterium]